MRLTDLVTPEEFALHARNKTKTDEEIEEIGIGILPYTDELSKHTAMPDDLITSVSMTLALLDSFLRTKSESKSIN